MEQETLRVLISRSKPKGQATYGTVPQARLPRFKVFSDLRMFEMNVHGLVANFWFAQTECIYLAVSRGAGKHESKSEILVES
jgi:hypothetical protein